MTWTGRRGVFGSLGQDSQHGWVTLNDKTEEFALFLQKPKAERKAGANAPAASEPVEADVPY